MSFFNVGGHKKHPARASKVRVARKPAAALPQGGPAPARQTGEHVSADDFAGIDVDMTNDQDQEFERF